MREDLFNKLVAAKRMELEYRLMGVYYKDDYEHPDNKPTYMFNQYVTILNDIKHDIINYNVTADQLDNLTATLGGLYFEYNLKLQGLSISDTFNNIVKDITGEELPDDIKELLQEDNDNEE